MKLPNNKLLVLKQAKFDEIKMFDTDGVYPASENQ